MKSVLLNRIKGFWISVLNVEWEFLSEKLEGMCPHMEGTKDCYCFRTQGLLPPQVYFPHSGSGKTAVSNITIMVFINIRMILL